MSDTTPTVSELLNAANWEYQQVDTPADLTPFTVDGQQLTVKNQADGMSCAAWLTPQGQVVISYEGTLLVGLVAAAADPAFSANQGAEDLVVISGNTTPGEKDALAFAQTVQSAAAT